MNSAWSEPLSPDGQLTYAMGMVMARIEALEKVHASYLIYQEQRILERDHHGAWDVAVNLSETECEMDGLKFALRALGVAVG